MKRMLFFAAVTLLAFAGVTYAVGSITGTSIKDNRKLRSPSTPARVRERLGVGLNDRRSRVP